MTYLRLILGKRGMLIAFASLTIGTLGVRAQQDSGIAGVVRDASGAVLPGVTVEAASPALIEKVRTVVSDSEGRYNITALVPGTYTVTFTLAGFGALRREGIALTGGFTASINVELRVGTIEETVIVSGAAPIVDTQNVKQLQRVSTQMLDDLPTGSKNLGSTLISLVPGLKSGTYNAAASSSSMGIYGSSGTNVGASYHGKTGAKDTFDGMSIMNSNSFGYNVYVVASNNIEEMQLETGGASAESNIAGLRSNVVPRQGGNDYSVITSGLFTDDTFASDNLDDKLRARGLTGVNKVRQAYDAQGSVGGPIKRDRLWFFATGRVGVTDNQIAGAYWNKVQGSGFYEPDLSRPGNRRDFIRALGSRFTWQATPKNKVSFFTDTQHSATDNPQTFTSNAPEVLGGLDFWPTQLTQVTWTSPVTNRLLFEGGATWNIQHWPSYDVPYGSPRNHAISILEQSRNFRYNARSTYNVQQDTNRYAQRFAVSYITGSHAFKVGIQAEQGPQTQVTEVNGDVNYNFNGGVPASVVQYAAPYVLEQRIWPDLGVFAQDQWTIKRLTVNYGLRFDYFRAYVPAQDLSAVQFVPARSFAEVECVPCWKDLSPRLGASYDLFGNSRTALKVSVGRYVLKQGNEMSVAANPVSASVLSVTRSWGDTNGNYLPDCDLTNFGENGECGVISDTNFGQNNPRATSFSPEVTKGFGVRPYLWDVAVEVQQELRQGVSVTAGYYRNWHHNLITFTTPAVTAVNPTFATQNQAVSPADFSPYCVAAPADARLPNGGGYQVCGLYDVNPNKFGQIRNVVVRTSDFGNPEYSSDFVNVNVNARLRSGIRLAGGLDTGRSVNDNCFVLDTPQQMLNCRIVTPFRGQTDLKLNGSVPLPGDFMVSALLQNTAGPTLAANYPVSNTVIAPALGRNLSACGTRVNCTLTATVPLIVPGTQFEERRNQLDLRLTKVFRIGPKTRLQASVDAYNVLNANPVLNINTTYGASWLQPTQILDGRLLQFSGQLTF